MIARCWSLRCWSTLAMVQATPPVLSGTDWLGEGCPDCTGADDGDADGNAGAGGGALSLIVMFGPAGTGCAGPGAVGKLPPTKTAPATAAAARPATATA